MTIEEKIKLKIKNNEFIDWWYISYCQKLSEDFIREFSDKVDWNYISYRQKLSFKFIKEFANKINWYYIALCYFNSNHERSWRTFS